MMVFQRLYNAASKAILDFGNTNAASAKSDLIKTKGVNLTSLVNTSLKAVPLPILPFVLDKVKERIDLAPEQSEMLADDDDIPSGGMKKTYVPFSKEWHKNNLFGAIGRTDNAPRRTYLALWYMREIQQGASSRL
uniref:Uncharacterized protein n=2 Tax=Aplanochytrium stocchinoi TaxID=215587 RepID=A0A7S3LP61_9STRA